MYINKDFPRYLHLTPLEVDSNIEYAAVMPSTGEQIPKNMLYQAVTPRMLKLIKRIPGFIRGKRTYFDLMKSLTEMVEHKPLDYSSVSHHLIEEETGMFILGIRINILPRNEDDYEVEISFVLPVIFDVELFNSIYTDIETQRAADDYAISATAITNSFKLIASNVDMERYAVKNILKCLNDAHGAMETHRWLSIRDELEGGVPAIFVMRRWGVLDKSKVVPNGENELERFEKVFNQHY